MNAENQMGRGDVTQQSYEEWIADYDGENRGSRLRDYQERRDADTEFDERGFDLIDDIVRVPPGEYPVKYVGFYTTTYRGSGKLVIEFTIDAGPNAGEILARYYNVEVRAPLGKNGGFRAKTKSDYFREYVQIWPDYSKRRRDRLSPNRFAGIRLRAEVKNVSRDWRGNELPAGAEYSKIARIIGRNE